MKRRIPLAHRLVVGSAAAVVMAGAVASAFSPTILARPVEGADEELERLFAGVAEGVRYEPYRGIARTSATTALMGSGNSFDQSVLLAERLRAAGYQVRFARGQLAPENLGILLRGMYPPHLPATVVAEAYAPFRPEADPSLRRAAEEHVWVEVFQGDDWLPLDPSFPRAAIGEAYARARETFSAPAEADRQRVTLVLHEEDARGREKELTRLSGAVSELALAPLTLVVRAIPVMGEAKAATGGSPARSTGMFGEALAGEEAAEEEEPAPPAEVGTGLVRTLDALGSVTELPGSVVPKDGGETPRREWLTVEIEVPGEPRRVVQRELLPVGTPMAAYRRHTVTIVNGLVSAELVEQARLRGVESARLDERRGLVREVGRMRVDDAGADAAARSVGRMGQVAGAVSGHLLSLLFARDSDALTRAVAARSGAAVSWPGPRVLITTLVIPEAGETARLSLDLRINDVGLHPYPGLPSRLGPLLQTARGLQDASLEGAIVGRAAGGAPVSGGAVLEAAVREGIPLHVLRGVGPAGGPRLPPAVEREVRKSLEAGYEVVVPERAVELESEERWAWLRVDPSTGGMVAVTEGGEHQGMTQYTLSGSSIGLNDKMGLAVGAIAGATTTEFMIAGGILEYGGATDEMVAFVEKHLKALLCNSCRAGASASAGASVGGASASMGCFEVGKEASGEVGVGVSIPFCESYQKGFQCASGLLLGGLKGESAVGVSAGVSGPGWSPPGISLGCE